MVVIIVNGFDPSAHLERQHLSSENACVAGWYVGLMWTPKYLVDVVGVSIEASGFVLLLPYILPAAGTLVGGCKSPCCHPGAM